MANILQVRWWVACGKVDRQSRANWQGVLTSGPTTPPDLSLQAPRQKPFLSAQLVFDSSGQLSQSPVLKYIQTNLWAWYTQGLCPGRYFIPGRGLAEEFPTGIPCSHHLDQLSLV